jgi:hypothetical protein
MTRRTTWAVPWLALGLLAGCGGSSAGATSDLDTALDVELPGFVSAAVPQAPTTLCDADPSGTGPTPPAFPAELGTPAAVFFQTAPATPEDYAWRASAEAVQQADPEAAPESDAEAAQAVVDAATAAAARCTFQVSTELHTDGDGIPDGAGTDGQSVDAWSGSGWTGVRIHRVVTGQEQTDRRLVRSGDVVLLVILRADRDDPEILEPADDFLEAVAHNLE